MQNNTMQMQEQSTNYQRHYYGNKLIQRNGGMYFNEGVPSTCPTEVYPSAKRPPITLGDYIDMDKLVNKRVGALQQRQPVNIGPSSKSNCDITSKCPHTALGENVHLWNGPQPFASRMMFGPPPGANANNFIQGMHATSRGTLPRPKVAAPKANRKLGVENPMDEFSRNGIDVDLHVEPHITAISRAIINGWRTQLQQIMMDVSQVDFIFEQHERQQKMSFQVAKYQNGYRNAKYNACVHPMISAPERFIAARVGGPRLPRPFTSFNQELVLDITNYPSLSKFLKNRDSELLRRSHHF